MGAGIVKGSETPNKSECLFLLGVYYDEELYEELMAVTDDQVITLENFLWVIQHHKETRDEEEDDDGDEEKEKEKDEEKSREIGRNMNERADGDQADGDERGRGRGRGPCPKKQINSEKYLGILYKISLIGKDIRKILMKYDILSLLIPILQQTPRQTPHNLFISSSTLSQQQVIAITDDVSHSSHSIPSLQLQQEYVLGILRNLSLDSEYHSELLQLAIQQDWFLFFPSSSSTSSTSKISTTFSPVDDSDLSTLGFYEHLIAFLRNLSLLSDNISTLDSINLIQICQRMILYMKWNQNLQQNLAGLLWNLVSYDQEQYLHKIFDSKYLLPHLLPYLTPERETSVFTQLNITGILFTFSVHPEFILPLFHFPELIQSLISLFQTCLPSSDSASSTTSSVVLPTLSPPLTMIQDHITGIFLSFSFYSELRVPLYKAQVTPLLMRFLAYSSTKLSPLPSSSLPSSSLTNPHDHLSPPEDDSFSAPPPLPSSDLCSFPPIISQLPIANSMNSSLLSALSSNHCRDIILQLAQERSLRHALCQEWRTYQLKPSLMSLLDSHLAAEKEIESVAGSASVLRVRK